jgi:hypothetical protein
VSLPMSLVPRDAVRLTDRVRRAVEDALAIPGRAVALLGAAEATLLQVRGLLDRIEATRASADELLRRAEDSRLRVDAVVLRAEETRAAATLVVGEVEAITAQVWALLDPWRAPLARLQPVVSLTRRLPELADRVESDVLPLMGELRSVAPDLRDLLAIVSELDEVIGRVPGMKRIKRRVETELAEDPARPNPTAGH